MADLQKRGSYSPRRAREQRAYRLAAAGAVSGGIGVVSLIAAFAGVINYGLPVVALIVAAICVALFRRTVNP